MTEPIDENSDGLSDGLQKLRQAALRDDPDGYLEDHWHTTSVGPEDEKWLIEKGLTSQSPDIQAFSALMLGGQPYMAGGISDETAALLINLFEQSPHPMVKFRSAVALCNMYRSKDSLSDEQQKMFDTTNKFLEAAVAKTIGGTKNEQDTMAIVAEELLNR